MNAVTARLAAVARNNRFKFRMGAVITTGTVAAVGAATALASVSPSPQAYANPYPLYSSPGNYSPTFRPTTTGNFSINPNSGGGFQGYYSASQNGGYMLCNSKSYYNGNQTAALCTQILAGTFEYEEQLSGPGQSINLYHPYP